MLVVGVTGRAQHGKDTIGQLLVEKFGFQRFAFADQLKELALRVDPWITTTWENLNPAVPMRLSHMVALHGWEDAKQNREVRRFLQELGTAVRDIVGESAWVDALYRQLLATHGEVPRAVITDVRFPNEAAFVSRMHGWVLRTVRPGFDNGVDPNHPSERYVPDLPVDFEFVNEDLEDFKLVVADFVETCILGAS